MHYLPCDIDGVFDEAVKGLGPAFGRPYFHAVRTWLDQCRKDLAQLWRKDDLWAMSEVITDDRGLVLRIVVMAGNYMTDLMTEIEQWARSVGCVKVVFTGQYGWVKRQKDYRPDTITFEKDL